MSVVECLRTATVAAVVLGTCAFGLRCDWSAGDEPLDTAIALQSQRADAAHAALAAGSPDGPARESTVAAVAAVGAGVAVDREEAALRDLLALREAVSVDVLRGP